MKILKSVLLVVGLTFSCSAAFAGGAFSAHDNVFLCLKKPGRSGQGYGFKALILNKRQKTIQYLSNSGGNELNEATTFTVTSSQIFVETSAGVRETVILDLINRTARWYENAYPQSNEVYPNCQSFPNFDENALLQEMRAFGSALN